MSLTPRSLMTSCLRLSNYATITQHICLMTTRMYLQQLISRMLLTVRYLLLLTHIRVLSAKDLWRITGSESILGLRLSWESTTHVNDKRTASGILMRRTVHQQLCPQGFWSLAGHLPISQLPKNSRQKRSGSPSRMQHANLVAMSEKYLENIHIFNVYAPPNKGAS